MRILIVDDHPLLRDGLRQTLARRPGVTIVAECSCGETALQAVLQDAPDLIILDIHLPDLGGIEVSHQILAAAPSTKIIVLSADNDRALVDQALQIGVCGYLLKSNAIEELDRAISAVMEGRLYLCPELASSVFGDYRKMLASATPPAKPLLTDRERQVLRHLAEGLQNKEIADRLGVSPKSVEKARARLMAKLSYRSVAELTRYAVREGIAPG